MLQQHVESGADVTLGCIEVPRLEASAFDVVHVDESDRSGGCVVLPYVDVARSARLSNVVVDRGVRIPEGLVVGEDPVLDAKRFRTTGAGISLISQSMIDRL